MVLMSGKDQSQWFHQRFSLSLPWHWENYTLSCFFFQAEDGIRDRTVTGVQTCALPISDASSYVRLLDGEPGRRPLTTLLAADAAARQERPAEALQLTDEPTPLQTDSLGDPEVVDPFFRTVLHLLRADWYQRRQDRDGAERELRWYQNNDFGRRSGPPQVAAVDWGFGTFARWRLALLLDSSNDKRACDLYREVRRAWAGGEAQYRARADSAAARTAALQCPPRA